MTPCDLLIVGVGGQGVVTLGDLLAQAALAAGVPVSVIPSKGMAQRGGFVKTEVRLGHPGTGGRIAPRTAHIVASMERAELLKVLPFVRPSGEIVLYDHVWEPTSVLLGDSTYPPLETVQRTLGEARAKWVVLEPASLPTMDDRPLPGNVVLLGALFSSPSLSAALRAVEMEAALVKRWPKAAEANLRAFRTGMKRGAAS
jgi:indolepyruvate ferredoxin oxidoreductase, beta subunit